MLAKRVEAVRVLEVHEMDDVKVLITRCRDYDEYMALPDAVEFEGQIFGKTGWDSDKCIACYRRDAPGARVVQPAGRGR